MIGILPLFFVFVVFMTPSLMKEEEEEHFLLERKALGPFVQCSAVKQTVPR